MLGMPVGAQRVRRLFFMLTTALTPITVAGFSAEAVAEQRRFDIPAGSLEKALAAFERQSGLRVSADRALFRGRQTAGASGVMSAQEALQRILASTTLDYSITGRTAVLKKLDAFAQADVTLDTITVTGPTLKRFGDIPVEQGIKADFQSSATKTGLSIKETPQSISVTTRQSMDDRQVRDAVTAVELTAGVVTSSYGNSGGPFAGRGIGTGDSFNIRGLDLNENRDIRLDGFAIPGSSFDMGAYDRIEVVKGPAGTLYGQGSLGGFVNFISKRPTSDPFVSATTQLGSFNTRRLEADASGAISPDFKSRFSAVYDDSGSYIDGVHTRIAQIAPSFEARINDSTRALLNIIYQDDNYIPSQGVPLRVRGNTATGPEIPRNWFIGVPSATPSTSQNFLATLRVDHEINDRWLATVHLQKSNQRYRRYFDSYGYDFSGLQTGTVNLWSDTALIRNDNWAADLRLDGKFDFLGREHRALFGFDSNRRYNRTAFGYQYVGTANIYTGNFGPPGNAANLPFNRDDETVSFNNAPYGQVVFSLTDRMKLLAGGRYDIAYQSALNLKGGGGRFSEKLNEAFTWRSGITYDVTPNVTAYATYGQSFNPVMDPGRGGKILDPEQGEGYEVGLKTEWFDKRLSANLALYQQELMNVPVPDPNDPSGRFSISGGKQRNRGIEFELLGKPLPGLTIGTALSWIDAKYVNPADPEYGLVPYGTVSQQAAVFASYEIQGGRFKGLGAGIMVVSIGDRSLSYANSGLPSDAVFLEGYERVDLNFFYKGLPDWDISFQIRNLFDEVYIERIRGISGGNFFGSPQAFLFRANYKLGGHDLKNFLR